MDDHKSHPIKKSSSKHLRPLHVTSKKSTTPYEYGAVVIDGRHKRVWKACERCRMKKTKCDGESPCKRCKDDGLVCIAGSRRKTDLKQLPRGYGEVLENTQYALIATIQKLYTMVCNNESWELGGPEINDKGEPVIHDIVSKLGCIRPSLDLPYAFPEGTEDFAGLEAQLQAAQSEFHSDGLQSRNAPEDPSNCSSALDCTDRASISESDRSYYNQLWAQQQQITAMASDPVINKIISKATPFNHARSSMDDGSVYSTRASFDMSCSMPLLNYKDFRSESPMFQNIPPFSPWSAGDEFLTEPSALKLTQQQRYQVAPKPPRIDGSIGEPDVGLEMSLLKAMQLDSLNFADETITPGILDCNIKYDLTDQTDSMIFIEDYECQMAMA